MFSHGYYEAAYISVSDVVAQWKRDALLFDRVYARYADPTRRKPPPDIPIELSFGLATVERSLSEFDTALAQMIAQACGTWEIFEKQTGIKSNEFDPGFDRQLADEYCRAGVMGEWSYSSTGAYLRRFSEGEQIAYEG